MALEIEEGKQLDKINETKSCIGYLLKTLYFYKRGGPPRGSGMMRGGRGNGPGGGMRGPPMRGRGGPPGRGGRGGHFPG